MDKPQANPPEISLNNPDDAWDLLNRLDAPEHLHRHVQLVSETAEELIHCLQQFPLTLDENLIRIGVILHDVGKIQHPEEFHQSGNLHEEKGRLLLTQLGVADHIAKVCVSHGNWHDHPSLEELVIALADKLWKGKRVPDLEQKLLGAIAEETAVDPWSLFEGLDSTFEAIAADGDRRLRQSIDYTDF